MNYNIFTDGSFTSSDGKFGLGFLIPDLRKVREGVECNDLIPYGYTIDMSKLSDKFLSARNIVGEVFASMMAIQKVKLANRQCSICVNYDYTGVEKWLTGEWTPKTDLTKLYYVWFRWNGLQNSVTFNHTKAHEDNKGNNLADMAARSGQDGIVQPRIEYRTIEGIDIFNLVFRTEDEEVRCGFSY